MSTPLEPATSLLSLAGRRALVTGAAGGIGSAVARRLSMQGAGLVLTDVASASARLAALAAELSAASAPALAVPADLSIKAEVDSLARRGRRDLGPLDILVNVAGIHAYPMPLAAVSVAQWDRMLAVNLSGPLWLCQALMPDMRESGRGAIVNVASDSAFDAIADEGPYGISKSGLVRLSAYLAKELAGTGVRVNSLAPGWVRTSLTEKYWSDPTTAATLAETIPARRFAEPDDVARCVLFLVSDLASYVNGHCLLVDGGRIAGVPA